MLPVMLAAGRSGVCGPTGGAEYNAAFGCR